VRGRRLVAERFTTARGQDHEGIAAVEDRADGVGLERQELVVAPDALDGLVDEFSLDDAGIIAKCRRAA
jgi:hypothetical protein